jgi:hypothetical protein
VRHEINEDLANETALIEWNIEGQFDHPLRLIAFNGGKGW